MKKIIISAAIVSVFAIVIYALSGLFTKSDEAYFKINPAFRHYISGFTAGVVSTDVAIRIKLNFDYADAEMLSEPCNMDLFDIKPAISGSTHWIDAQTVEFRPESKLPHEQVYLIDFHLHKLLQLPDSMKIFKFHIRTMKQAMEVNIVNVMPYDNEHGSNYGYVKVIGEILTADAAIAADIERTLKVLETDKKTEWIHGQKSHTFYIDSIRRKPSAYFIEFVWDGKPISAAQKGRTQIEIPAAHDFKMTAAKAEQLPEQKITIQFSDPIDESQNLDGLIRLSSRFRYLIDGNELFIFPINNLRGLQTITLEKAIKNSMGKSLEQKEVAQVTFEDIKPQIKLSGKGVIVPSSEGLTLPFEAVNLKAVDVKIIKIFEDNVLQFLQSNRLDGRNDIKRVGRPIFDKTVELTNSEIVDFGKWNAFALNLEELIKIEPGAIYQVSLSFSKEHSTYPCSDDEKEVKLSDFSRLEVDDRSYDQLYSYYYDYDDYDYYYYDWSERNNPCSPSYYYNKSVSRNVLASDMGIIAKKNNANETYVFVNDLRTTKPWPNARIEFYNLQQQLISTTVTNQEGIASAKLPKTPYFIVAKSEKQRAYLVMDNNAALSLSMFDVSGNNVDKGLKGFIYGERGVWRPGDSLYLTFILEDKLSKLPPSHPVSFTLLNPMGQVAYRTVKTNHINGFYSFHTATSDDAPTGNWTAVVGVGGTHFSQTVRIETIIPNRLKIDLDFEDDKLFAHRQKNIVLKSEWLHGAAANKLKADVKVSFSRSRTIFENFKDFTFDDASRYFQTEEYTIFDARLDENGRAEIPPFIKTDFNAPGVLRANFQVRVFENSGAFSIDRLSIPYYPYETYIGIQNPQGSGNSNMLVTDKDHKINLISVDVNGKIKRNTKVDIEVYKLDWNWWWDDSGDNLSNYINAYWMSPIHEETLNMTSGRGSFNLRINSPDWGRYYIRVSDKESGHATGTTIYIDHAEWAGRSRMRETSAATLLSITSDKSHYNVGEKIDITFPSGSNGRALVSIEKGNSILKTYWVDTENGHTTFSFAATKDMSPNIFAHVSYIQPHAQVENDLPIRLYGVVPLNVEDKNTILNPVINMADVLRPERSATVKISESDKRTMTYTLAIVDEGLLDLTRFRTPNPWRYFFAKEALSIRTWDLYDYVAGAYAGKLRRLLNIGGDDDLMQPADVAKANRFKPMVRFLGPFHLEGGKTNTHTFEVPQYVGSCRVMVVAGHNGAYGNAEKTVAVRNPLMILGTLPRVLGPNETVELPVSVFAMEDNIKNVSIEIRTNEMFNIIGDKRSQISFSRTGDKMVGFTLKTASTVGVGKVSITAVSGNQRASHDIEIAIRNPNQRITDVIEVLVEPGKTVKQKFSTLGMAGTNKGTLEISSIPPINLEKRLSYLMAYPHGCLEQITSGAFPQLFLEHLVELDENNKKTIQYNINTAIRRIGALQHSNGGLTYWAGAGYTDDWATNYAGHFMLVAADKGYTLPIGFINNFVKYQKQMASSWVPHTRYYNSDLIQAYRLYTLALSKSPDLGAMNRLRELNTLSAAAKWRLAAAYSLIGQTQVARRMTANLSTEVSPYRELSYTYGSSVRDKAMILETLTLLDEKTKAVYLSRDIALSMASEQWHSTQTTAYALLALSQYFQKSGSTHEMDFSYQWAQNKGGYKGDALISQSDMGFKGRKAEDVLEIGNKGKSTLFARIIIEGIPEAGTETKASFNDMVMTVSFKTVDGQATTIESIKQGSDFIGEVVVSNPGFKGEYKEIALSFIVPSGWEIHNPRMAVGESRLSLASHNFMDIRDDRIYMYFNLRAGESKKFQFMFNAAYIGKYFMPAINAETMYDATINARIPGRWVEITK